MKPSWIVAWILALSALTIAGCGTTASVMKQGVHVGHKKSAPAINPSVPQSGGSAAATEWLRQHATIETIPVPGGELLFPTGGGPGVIYVSKTTGKWVQLPIGVPGSDFERATPNGGLLFSSAGYGEAGELVPFPFQWLFTPRPNGTFSVQNGPMYFPLNASVSFGNKSNALLTSDSTIPNGIQITFGPEPGHRATFFEGVVSVPPTLVTYNPARRELILHCSQATLAKAVNLHALTNAEVSGVKATETPSGVDVAIFLTKAVRFFTGKIVIDRTTQIPHLQIWFANETPSTPWGP